jgi:hypothetical protein
MVNYKKWITSTNEPRFSTVSSSQLWPVLADRVNSLSGPHGITEDYDMTPEHLSELLFAARVRLTWFWSLPVVVLAASALITAGLQQRDYERGHDYLASLRG